DRPGGVLVADAGSFAGGADPPARDRAPGGERAGARAGDGGVAAAAGRPGHRQRRGGGGAGPRTAAGPGVRRGYRPAGPGHGPAQRDAVGPGRPRDAAPGLLVPAAAGGGAAGSTGRRGRQPALRGPGGGGRVGRPGALLRAAGGPVHRRRSPVGLPCHRGRRPGPAQAWRPAGPGGGAPPGGPGGGTAGALSPVGGGPHRQRLRWQAAGGVGPAGAGRPASGGAAVKVRLLSVRGLDRRDRDYRRVLQEAAAVLRAGGLVAFPTETVYGLGASIEVPGAVERIFAAK